MLANLIATGGAYDPVATFVGLFTDIVDNGPSTDLANLTLAPASLATAVALTAWTAPYHLSGGNSVADANPKHFTPANSGEGCTVLGFYLADAATSGALIEFVYFDQPFTLVDEHSTCTVIKRLVLDCEGVWDASISYNG